MVAHWLRCRRMCVWLVCVLALVATIDRASEAHAQPPADVTDPDNALSVLSSRVKPFDTIYVLTADGKEVKARFSHVSDTSLSVLARHGVAREIPAGDVLRVWRRTGTQAKRGMWIGAMVGAAVLTIPWLADSDMDATAGEKIVAGTLLGGMVGGFYGGIMGAVVPKRQEVYRSSTATARLVPLLGRGRNGVLLSVRF